MTILFLLVLILYRLHYMTSTNAGLCQGNMSWCFEVRGPNYHWVAELYEQLNLPVLPAVVRALQKSVEERAATLKKEKTQEAKANRVHMKVARAEDQESRRKWLKRKAIEHTYKHDEDGDLGDDDSLEDAGEATVGESATEVISGKSCRCGSTEHKRTSHKSCPLNKKK